MFMEKEHLLALTYQLRDLINNDETFLILRNLEHDLDLNEEIIELSTKMHVALEAFEKCDSDQEKIILQQRLHEAKLALDMHPLVREYYKAYQPVRLMYQEIQTSLFTPFNLHFCGDFI
mgnify:CR=1 FL=1